MFKKSHFLYIALLLCIFFVSCSPQRRLTNLLTRHPDLIDTNKVVTTIYRDTTIFVPVLGTDTVYKYGTIKDTIYANSGTAHASTFVVRDTLRLNVWQSDTTLTFRIDSAIRELQIKDTEIIRLETDNEKTKFERGMNKVIVGLVVIAFIVLVGFFKKIFN